MKLRINHIHRIIFVWLYTIALFSLLGCAKESQNANEDSQLEAKATEVDVEIDQCDRYLALQGNQATFVQKGCVDGHEVVTRAATSQKLYLMPAGTQREPRPAEAGKLVQDGTYIYWSDGTETVKLGSLEKSEDQMIKLSAALKLDLMIKTKAGWRSWQGSDGAFADAEAIVIYN